jgi:hypothetical protein
MSIAEIQRFAADLTANATLRVEAEKAFEQATIPSAQVDGVVAFANAKGYGFTASELNEKVAKAKVDGKTVTDGELDTVSGGFLGPDAGGFGAFTLFLLLPTFMPSGNSSSSSPSS